MSDVRWEGLTHEEIYARVQQGPGRGASSDAEAAWGTVESTIRAVDDQLSRAVRQIGIDWQGAAADRVHGGMTVMSNWALDAAGDALLTREGIAGQADAAGHVRTAMPPPRSAALDEAVQQGFTGTGYVLRTDDVGALEDGIAADRARAVDLMNRYTSDSSGNQRLMNYWTPPPSVVVETVLPAQAGGRGHGAGLGAAVGAGAGVAAAALTAGRVGASGPAAGRGATGGQVDPASRPTAGGLDPALGPTAGAGDEPPGTGGSTAGLPGSGSTTRIAPPGGAPLPGGLGVPGAGPTRTGTRVPAPGGAGTGGTPAGGVRPIVPGPSARPGWDAPLVPGPPSRSTAVPIGEGPGQGGPGYRPGPDGPSGAVPRATAGDGRLSEAAVTERAAAGRGATAGQGFLPLGGAGRSGDPEHRRASYLVDDTDAFADDRWFTPPVIGGDDLEVVRA